MQQIASAVINEFLAKGVTTEKEMDKVRFDKSKGLWVGEFHLTMLRSQRDFIDAKTLIDKFGHAFIGKYTLQDIQLSSRADLENADGGRMARELFDQIKDNKATYACESKILLSYDLC